MYNKIRGICQYGGFKPSKGFSLALECSIICHKLELYYTRTLLNMHIQLPTCQSSHSEELNNIYYIINIVIKRSFPSTHQSHSTWFPFIFFRFCRRNN